MGIFKKQLRKKNQSPTLSSVVVDLIRTVVEDISATNIWENCVKHIVDKENEYCILPPVEPIIINPDDESSSESDFDEDD